LLGEKSEAGNRKFRFRNNPDKKRISRSLTRGFGGPNKDGGTFDLMDLDRCSLRNEVTFRQDVEALAVDFGTAAGA
jgi:hypothetical protein